MRKVFLSLLVLCSLLAEISAECANACSGHGKCTSYDMCICNRNWQANDCSERICQFGLAHVDTPKGDLDMSGDISGPSTIVAENSFTYPYGTSEQFPTMEDSDLQVIPESAHYYMECSNKGLCNRQTGECECYEGYDGVACQRASCPGYPNSCSGHGVCKSIRQLAHSDNGNVYELWDKHSTMGCDCDPGYYGPDCSLRQCKSGVDPLYIDDISTVKYSIFDFALLTTDTSATFTDGQSESKDGYWAIRFYDSFGEDWLTKPIIAGATCAQVVAALEALPNNVIPAGKTYCTLTSRTNREENYWFNFDAQHPTGRHAYSIFYNISLWEAASSIIGSGEFTYLTPIRGSYSSYETTGQTHLSGYIYRIKFFGNPGYLQQPEIEVYLDGKRPSLVSPSHTVITKVWTDGQQGENNDYFADHCDGVTATIDRVNSALTLSTTEAALLKACLGSSDFDTTNNVDIQNWDYGSQYYPHIVKLVRTVTVYTDGGYYAVLYYDSSSTRFKLLNPFMPPDMLITDSYEIYTTHGVLALVTNRSSVSFDFGSRTMYTTNTSYDLSAGLYGRSYDGSVSCEWDHPFGRVRHCLDRGDIITFLNWEHPAYNPPHINLYTVKRLFQAPPYYSSSARYGHFSNGYVPAKGLFPSKAMTNTITVDLATNWGVSQMPYVANQSPSADNPFPFYLYKFFPAANSTYNYVAPCSNRGICDETQGICQCFSGYTSDDCSEQSSLAI